MPIFSYESKFSQVLLKFCSACYLNLLWILCSLPIFTMGAATTALYYGTLKIVRGEETRYAHVDGMDDQGALLVTLTDGTKETVFSGEVSVRGMYGYL